MTKINLLHFDVINEIDRISRFIDDQVGQDKKIVLGLSGGIDSDVVARLLARVIGPRRMKCFIVLQDQFEDKYVTNARNLAGELGIHLIEIPLGTIPSTVISVMAHADPAMDFRPYGLLDVGRTKVTVRTMIYSAYMERGYLTVGPSNRTEIELGYFIPFGDALAHFSPIAHLYKTQVQHLAHILGTHQSVLEQQPSAGFWVGDSDIEGISYWLYHGAPIQVELDLSDQQRQEIYAIQRSLSFLSIDTTLHMLNEAYDYASIAQASELPETTVVKIASLKASAAITKNRPLGVRL